MFNTVSNRDFMNKVNTFAININCDVLIYESLQMSSNNPSIFCYWKQLLIIFLILLILLLFYHLLSKPTMYGKSLENFTNSASIKNNIFGPCPMPNGFPVGNLRNAQHGLCMRPLACSLGYLVILDDCRNSNEFLWELNPNRSIRNLNLNQCLMPAAGIFDDAVHLEKCKCDPQPLDYQSWAFVKSNIYPDLFQLVNTASDCGCLDVVQTQYGLTVVENNCNGSLSQLWKFLS